MTAQIIHLADHHRPTDKPWTPWKVSPGISFAAAVQRQMIDNLARRSSAALAKLDTIPCDTEGD